MNPLIMAILGIAGVGAASMLLRKSNAVVARLNEYWRRIDAGDLPDDILREWFEEASPLLTIEEVEELIPDGFFMQKADRITDRGRFVRGLDPNRVTATGRVTPHWGVDLAADEGSPVYAAKTSVVCLIEPICGYGNVVGLSSLDDDQESLLYAHLHWAEVGLGQVVEGGQVIGRMGRTTHCPDGSPPRGWAPGQAAAMASHLHLEVHPRRIPVMGARVRRLDPVVWLQQQGIGMSL